MSYRITMSVNGLTPFTFPVSEFPLTVTLANALVDFDNGNLFLMEGEVPQQSTMLSSYKAYRRKNNVNHSDLIFASTCTIDKQDEEGHWWVVSENLENEEHELGLLGAWED